MSRSGAVERPSRDDATPDSLIMSFVSFAFGSERSLKSQMENRFRESSRVRRGKPPERFLLAMRLSRYAGRTPGTGYRGRGSHRGTGGLLAPGAHRNIRIESLCFLRLLPRKEVIQPHVPVRLPCYDFTPLALHTFDASPRGAVGPAASGADDSGGVTGGVYKARERIHRGMLIRDY